MLSLRWAFASSLCGVDTIHATRWKVKSSLSRGLARRYQVLHNANKRRHSNSSPAT